jgi:hypothetical protein
MESIGTPVTKQALEYKLQAPDDSDVVKQSKSLYESRYESRYIQLESEVAIN